MPILCPNFIWLVNYTAINFIENVPLGAEDFLGTKLKKILRRIFFKKCSDQLIPDSQIICGCLTLNGIHIKSTSLIICSINDNLTNTSSLPPHEGKKTTVYSTINNFSNFHFSNLNSNFYLLEI